MMTLSDTSPTESLVVQTRSRKSDIVSHNAQATHPKSHKRMRKKNRSVTLHKHVTKVGPSTLLSPYFQNVSLTGIECWVLGHAQAIPQGQALTVEIVLNPPPKQTAPQNISQRKRTKPTPPSLMKLRQELPTGKPIQPRRGDSALPVRAIERTKPRTPRRTDRRNNNSATGGLVRDPHIRPNVHAREDLAAMKIPNSCRNTNHHPNADRNSNARGSRHRRWNPNCQQPNTDKTKETMQALEVEGM